MKKNNQGKLIIDDGAMAQINSLPGTVTLMASEWIKCKDRVPEESYDVLMYSKATKMRVGNYYPRVKTWSHCINPDYWMPLPLPPEDRK